ncbi:SHOCT domain-containing protein [Fodinicurvata fenggangensis]|uniref:SHOCT domain-containing protein n=1 Tax=Fodinicurvata fenggangensis TaxID=1121830 RepID=UPI00047C6171|nr:SHOCT domain-containing protein [Fodinicurvata fenggangensis]
MALVITLLYIGVQLLGAVLILRAFGFILGGRPATHAQAETLLRARLDRGEINAAEFEKRLHRLRG